MNKRPRCTQWWMILLRLNAVRRRVRTDPLATSVNRTWGGHKHAPPFDGVQSWFACEDIIDTWSIMNELEEEKRGPWMRKPPVLETSHGPPGAGVHFKIILRHLETSDDRNWSIWNRFNRMTKCQFLLQRLMRSWMDIYIYMLSVANMDSWRQKLWLR